MIENLTKETKSVPITNPQALTFLQNFTAFSHSATSESYWTPFCIARIPSATLTLK